MFFTIYDDLEENKHKYYKSKDIPKIEEKEEPSIFDKIALNIIGMFYVAFPCLSKKHDD